MKTLFYIGDNFYPRSGTSMSSIYEEGTYKRWDWGKVQVALREGESISIRPASEEEMLWAYKNLQDILDRHPNWE